MVYEVIRSVQTDTATSTSTEEENPEEPYIEGLKRMEQEKKGVPQEEVKAQRESLQKEFEVAQKEFLKMMEDEGVKRKLFSGDEEGEEEQPTEQPRKRPRRKQQTPKKVSPLDKMWANLKETAEFDEDDDDDDLELEDTESK